MEFILFLTPWNLLYLLILLFGIAFQSLDVYTSTMTYFYLDWFHTGRSLLNQLILLWCWCVISLYFIQTSLFPSSLLIIDCLWYIFVHGTLCPWHNYNNGIMFYHWISYKSGYHLTDQLILYWPHPCNSWLTISM